MVTLLSVPTPVPMLQLTPELDPSLDTVTVKACVPPPTRLAVAGLIAPTLIGVSVTVAAADLVVSVLLVAVTVAEVAVITAGAVYTPAEVTLPVEAVHVTPALAPSAVTVAVNVWLAPPMRVAVVGLTPKLIGVSVTVAAADLVASVLLVAVTVAEVAVITAGAVYTPAEVTVPVEAVHVTPALAESFVTVAVNVWLAPPMRVAVVGLTATLIAGGVDGLPLPAHPAASVRRVSAAKPATERMDSRKGDMRSSSLQAGHSQGAEIVSRWPEVESEWPEVKNAAGSLAHKMRHMQ